MEITIVQAVLIGLWTGVCLSGMLLGIYTNRCLIMATGVWKIPDARCAVVRICHC